MASSPDPRSSDDIRRDIQQERGELAQAADSLREEIGKAADVTTKLRANLPAVTAAALGAGFVLAGGIGAAARMLARRSREGHERARFGRFVVLERD